MIERTQVKLVGSVELYRSYSLQNDPWVKGEMAVQIDNLNTEDGGSEASCFRHRILGLQLGFNERDFNNG